MKVYRECFIEPFGRVLIYMKHNKDFGKCIFEDGFETPNMPKLPYAVDFTVNGRVLKLLDRLNPELLKYSEGYVFEKRDGFNLLFYEWNNQIIPKTRIRPIASIKTRKIVKLPEFPLKEIIHLVKDGYIPYLEVWGTKLDEYDITHGCVNVAKVQEIENLPTLNVDVIAIKDVTTRKFLHPERWFSLAIAYGLKPVKFYGSIKITYDNIIKLMRSAEEKNKEVGDIITEGFVLHCWNPTDYSMFKVKPYSVMYKDVILNFTLLDEKIHQEITKILLDVSALEIAKNLEQYYKLLLQYLSEENRLFRKQKMKARDIFLKRIAKAIREEFPQADYRELARLGIHSALFKHIKEVDSF